MRKPRAKGSVILEALYTLRIHLLPLSLWLSETSIMKAKTKAHLVNKLYLL